MVDVVGDRHLFLQRGVVRADGVVDPGALAGEKEAVVARVIPGQDLGLHRLRVEFLVPVEHVRGLVGVDRRRLAICLEHLGAERPGDRPVGGVRVGAVADRDADGIALLLEDLAHRQQLGPRLRRILEARLLEVRLIVGAGEGDPEPRHALPAGLGLVHLGRERVPAAELLAELVHEVVEVGVQVLVEEGIGARAPVHVVARLRLRLGRDLCGHLQMRHGVDADRAVGLLREDLRLPAQLVVGGGHEMVPGQEGQLALLRERGGTAERQRGRETGRGGGRSFQELTTGRAGHGHSPWGSGGSRTVAD